MPAINFLSLCESILEEADRSNLLDIARQATTWRNKWSNATTFNQKTDALHNLIVLQDFLRDEFGADLTDDEFQRQIVNHSLHDRGLLNLTPLMLAKLSNWVKAHKQK